MRIVYGVVVILIALSLSGFAFIYSGVYNVAAAEDHSPLGQWALHTTMKRSVETRADAISVPDDFDAPERIVAGAQAYDQLCAACHLKPGQDDTLLRQGLNPKPPSLLAMSHFGPAEQFWIIKNGIKMTGMPAWGTTHEDQDLWELTAFVQKLPDLSEAEYRRLVQQSAAGGDDGHDHDHGSMGGMMGSETEPHGKPRHHEMAEATQPKPTSHSDGGGHHHEGNSGHSVTAEPAPAPSEEAAQDPAPQHRDDHYADGHTH